MKNVYEATARCILSLFYIRPQHNYGRVRMACRCILSLFYIRPQPRALLSLIIDKLRGLVAAKNQHAHSGEVDSMQIYRIEILPYFPLQKYE